MRTGGGDPIDVFVLGWIRWAGLLIALAIDSGVSFQENLQVRDDSLTGPPGSRRQPLAIGLVCLALVSSPLRRSAGFALCPTGSEDT